MIKGAAATLISRLCEIAVAPTESITWKTNDPNVPGSVGVPEITPVLGLRAKPGGIVPRPFGNDHTYGGVPPVAWSAVGV